MLTGNLPGLLKREGTTYIQVASLLHALCNSCSVIPFAFIVSSGFLLTALLL